jgi:hypothetical protein
MATWISFSSLVHGSLDIVKEENYQTLGCQISLNVYLWYSHLSFYPRNLQACSDEKGEWFHQDIAKMEQHLVMIW